MNNVTETKQIDKNLLKWLMSGDVSVQYQASRDLLGSNKKTVNELQLRIQYEGWGLQFLKKQKADGHWGKSFYQPKWTSTHYALLDLKTIGLPRNNEAAQKSVSMVLNEPRGAHGGINLAQSLLNSDVCVNGMALSYCSWFLPKDNRLKIIVDYLLETQMKDGGWNCEYLNPSTTHSSLHSTISVLEGLLEFKKTGQRYRHQEILAAEKKAIHFLIRHNLYQSHRTGKTIDVRMLKLSFPCRWRYDILRCLDYFRNAGVHYDPAMESALKIIAEKRQKDGTWPLQEKHKGLVHFEMEKVGSASRWNTLRCLRVFKHFGFPIDQNRHS